MSQHGDTPGAQGDATTAGAGGGKDGTTAGGLTAPGRAFRAAGWRVVVPG